jgi:hypothetical protein
MKILLTGFFLLLVTPLYAHAATGFFTGPRAEAIDVLRRASGPQMKSDEALALVLGARTKYYGNGDRYVDYFIDQILSHLYLKAGDADAATAHGATAMETYTAAMEKDGIAQAMYTLFLVMYDLEFPPAELFGGAENEVNQLDTQIKALREMIDGAVADMSPKDAAMASRFGKDIERALTDIAQGMAQNDVRRMKRGRNDALGLMDKAQRILSEREEQTAEDKEDIATERKMFESMLNLAIASSERNRRLFERSARDLAAQMNGLFERDQ